MCGICGVFDPGHPLPPPRSLLEGMLNTIRHRGPDDEGFYRAPGIGLAVRRLSIIDLQGGHQPLANEDSSVWVAYNGEIYNFQELRRDLIRKNHQFQTGTDTEVIVHLYEEHGADCFNLLDGMFSLALYDSRSQGNGSQTVPGKLILARDRFGKKPLYYTRIGQKLIFGSEIKPILKHPEVSRDLDPQALHHYLSLLVIPAPLSIFREIRKLPAGSLLEADASGFAIRRYWKVPTLGNQRADAGSVSRIRTLLSGAVEKRLMSEVPLGAFLSGGLDSSTVVALMQDLSGTRVKTFAVGFEGPETHNELPAARLVAEHLGTEHHELLVAQDILPVVEETVRFADEPFAISSAIPLLLLSRFAREHVTVVLTGDGGDEVFGGYDHYLYERWAQKYRRWPSAVDKLIQFPLRFLPDSVSTPAGRFRGRASRFIAAARAPVGARRLAWASGFTELEKGGLYANPTWSAAAPPTSQFLEGLLSGEPEPDSVQQHNVMDMGVWLSDEMLAKVDRMTMAASIEARCPLLDRELVDYMASFSMDSKIPGSRKKHLKHLLRSAAGELLPPAILSRPKHGFNVPLDAWFRQVQGKKYLTSVLSSNRIRERGIFDGKMVEQLRDQHEMGSMNASNRLYALLVFEVWAAEYL